MATQDNAPSLAAALWAQAQPKAFQCLFHPFVASLAAGSLAARDFEAFLLQDAYFLHGFARAFAHAATKTSTSQHTLAIVHRMGGVERELRTHAAFLASFGVELFAVDDVSAAPATQRYVDFLLTTAKRSDSVAEILAAMTPCVRLYAFLGQRIVAVQVEQQQQQQQQQPNPYQRWIDAYSTPEFYTAADEAEQQLDELAAYEGVSYETLLPLYNAAMELELRFFEQYFPMARAAASFPRATLSLPIQIRVDLAAEDIERIETLQPGQYEVIVDTTPSETRVSVQLTTLGDQSDGPSSSAAAIPLLAVLLAPLPPSTVVATQSKAELVAFIKALEVGGSFEKYSHPAFEYARRVARVLTIAGSDSGGGAGVQADMKACTNLGVFSTSAITAVTVQNTLGVHAIHAVPVDEIADQITCVLDDIGTDVVKTGMLATEEIIEMVAAVLECRAVPLVVDPVMVATSGHRLLKEAAHHTMVAKLFPLATIITPNIPEASALLGDREIESIEQMQDAARDLAQLGPAFVLVKGGHLKHPPRGLVHDVLFDAARGAFHVITNPKLATRNTHGTGCTLAAAIAAQFAKSGDMVRAVSSAIAYLHGVLEESQALAIGTGDNGPMLHVA